MRITYHLLTNGRDECLSGRSAQTTREKYKYVIDPVSLFCMWFAGKSRSSDKSYINHIFVISQTVIWNWFWCIVFLVRSIQRLLKGCTCFYFYVWVNSSERREWGWECDGRKNRRWELEERPRFNKLISLPNSVWAIKVLRAGVARGGRIFWPLPVTAITGSPSSMPLFWWQTWVLG